MYAPAYGTDCLIVYLKRRRDRESFKLKMYWLVFRGGEKEERNRLTKK